MSFMKQTQQPLIVLIVTNFNLLKNITIDKIMRSFKDIFVIRVCKYIHSNTSINPQVIDSL